MFNNILNFYQTPSSTQNAHLRREVGMQPSSPAEECAGLHALGTSNLFASHDEKHRTEQMAALAGLMYKEESSRVVREELFPRGLYHLATPQDLGVSLPAGLSVAAFRYEDEVIVAIRGTELGRDTATLVKNLIADLGIGRHKSNEELVRTIRTVQGRIAAYGEFKELDGQLDMLENIIHSRVTGDTELARSAEVGKRVVTKAGSGALQGGKYGAAVASALAVSAIGLGLASAGVGGLLLLAMTGSAALTGAGVNATIETAKSATIADGYPILQGYIAALDAYFVALKERHIIRDGDNVCVTGHSLAGYLAGVTGRLHGDEVYAFNGPGVTIDEVRKIVANLGLERDIRSDIDYRSISMECDFIGQLSDRDGGLRSLAFPNSIGGHAYPLPSDFPSYRYTAPLSHHGIDLMQALLRQSKVLALPAARLCARVEEADEDLQ